MSAFHLDRTRVRRNFARAAASYEQHDALQREVQADLLGRLDFYLQAPERVLDVGAGTGALTAELLARSAEVAAAEPSAPFVDALRARYPGVDARVAAAEQLPWPDEAFDVALAQLVVAFMADAPAAVAEMARVARTVAVCMWGVQEVEMFAAIERTARAAGIDRGEQGARRYRTAQELEELLAPLGAVELGELDVTADYSGFDDFWNALARQVGPAGAWLAALDDEQRARVREQLHRELGSPEGRFTLGGRAFAARVTRA